MRYWSFLAVCFYLIAFFAVVRPLDDDAKSEVASDRPTMFNTASFASNPMQDRAILPEAWYLASGVTGLVDTVSVLVDKYL